MKRGMSKLLSVLLIATLVFTSASVAFAGTEKEQAVRDTAAAVKEAAVAAVQQQAKAQTKAATTKAAGVIEGKFNLVTIASEADLGKLASNAAAISYSVQDPVANGYGYAQQVNINAKGTVVIGGGVLYDYSSATSAWFGLYTDDKLANSVYEFNVPTGASDAKVIQVSKPGTYYLGVRSVTGQNAVVRMSAGYINGADRTITSGKEILVGQKNEQTNYFKFKANKTGYLEVISTEDMAYNQVTLCNNKKKAISNSVYMRYAPTFGVKAGTTYYVKIKARDNLDGAYLFKVTNKQFTGKGGKNKAKATTIKKGQKKNAVIIIGNGQENWYKFKLNGKKNVKIVMKGRTNNEMKIQVYKGNKKISGTNGTFNYTHKSYTVKSIGKWDKGTYYIKISRGNKKSSGYYTLSWK